MEYKTLCIYVYMFIGAIFILLYAYNFIECRKNIENNGYSQKTYNKNCKQLIRFINYIDRVNKLYQVTTKKQKKR